MAYLNSTKLRCFNFCALERIASYIGRTSVVRNYGGTPTCQFPQSINVQSFFSKDQTESLSPDPSTAEKLIAAYRRHGHKIANVNPLQPPKCESIDELDPECLDKQSTILLGGKQIPVEDLTRKLRNVYCGSSVLDTSAVSCASEREWIYQAFVTAKERCINNEEKIVLFQTLLKAQCLDHFLMKKFPTLKRYSGEGAEGMQVVVKEILNTLSKDGIEQVFVGLPHRGRNNLLHGELNYPMELMIRKIKGMSEFPENVLDVATGDVLSHLNISQTCYYGSRKLHVNVLANSSHLEAVNPIVAGKCRARQQTLKDGYYSDGPPEKCGNKVGSLLIHGDASFTGQGIVMECLNMSSLPGFDVGGIIHLIVNNQVGFTTNPELGRSTPHASDPGRMIGCPVLRVNGDDAEELLRIAALAAQYRQQFRKDIIIDMMCYRRWGHNELDDPSFTQPVLYDVIKKLESLPNRYGAELSSEGVMSEEDRRQWEGHVMSELEEQYKRANDEYKIPEGMFLASAWKDMVVPSTGKITTWDTGCDTNLMRFVGAKSVQVPDDFVMHDTIAKSHAKARLDRLVSGKPVDWSLAEAFAFGSLLQQGVDVRLCGEDSGRGTFSHRHAQLTCQRDERVHVPLNHMDDRQPAKIEVVCSLLSEEAVLGFEYGVSIESPNRLVVWEAQFGDFFNGAQIIFDAFISSGEAKWMYQSGLVVLLPHGYDGSGPEHSSCRIERFLQCTNSSETDVDGDGVNMSVCNPTTAAQYFHLLRRQMVRNFRKPLIVAAPKTLLRAPAAMSPMEEFQPGTHFRPVMTDPNLRKDPQTVIFCSGKHYFALEAERAKRAEHKCAIVRLEQLCPFPATELAAELSHLSKSAAFVWSQEEPRNMGAWSFVAPRFRNLLGVELNYAGRAELAAPAVGIGTLHEQQKNAILHDTFSFVS